MGTRTVGSTSVTSPSMTIRWNDAAAPGLALERMCRTYQLRKSEVVGDGRAVLAELALEELGGAPRRPDLPEPGAPLVIGPVPRIVVGSPALDSRLVEDQRVGPLRVGGGEEDRDANALVGREERRAFDAGVVHDGADVVHPGLERRHVPQSVGQAHAALVEHRDARERREPLRVADEQRLVPDRGEVRQAAAHHDQVGRP